MSFCGSCGAIRSEDGTLNPACYTLPPAGGSVVSEQDMLITRDTFASLTGLALTDDVADMYIRVASAKVESFLNRKLLFKENHVERVDGCGTNVVHLSLFPVYKVSFIGFNCCAKENHYCCDDRYYLGMDGLTGSLVSPAGFPVTSRVTNDDLLVSKKDADKYGGIIVVYSGGYLLDSSFTPAADAELPDCDCEPCMYLPDVTTARMMPDVIQMVVAREAATEYNKMQQSHGCKDGIKREKLDDYEIEYFKPSDMRGENVGGISSSGLSFTSQEALLPYKLIY